MLSFQAQDAPFLFLLNKFVKPILQKKGFANFLFFEVLLLK